MDCVNGCNYQEDDTGTSSTVGHHRHLCRSLDDSGLSSNERIIMTTQQNAGMITDADVQTLLKELPLAAEVLRRIIAERIAGDLQRQVDELKSSKNGLAKEAIPETVES